MKKKPILSIKKTSKPAKNLGVVTLGKSRPDKTKYVLVDIDYDAKAARNLYRAGMEILRQNPKDVIEYAVLKAIEFTAKSAKGLALLCVLTAGAVAQQAFWPADMQVMFEGREYELRSTSSGRGEDERVFVCRVVRWIGGHMYEVQPVRTKRGTRHGEPVYYYETNPQKSQTLNVGAWGSIREIHVESRQIRESPTTYAHKEAWDSIDEKFGRKGDGMVNP
ncbi:MAG: hypothetical protein EBU96_08270 [Actinobacteria bacterium]|nr:hypothetical protein [Actinomycetota bacterium]